MKLLNYLSRGYVQLSKEASRTRPKRPADSNVTMDLDFCNTPIALANAFDPDQTRGEAGNFSAELSDAVSAAHAASATAHEKVDAESHTRAAKLHRVAAKRATAENKPGHAATHEGIAAGHDAMAACCDDEPVLANSSNEAIDNEGWALIAPFGNHAKTRFFRENGQLKEQKFIQVLDNESADTLVNGENSLFRKLKRALVGIPVYKGHGDLNDHDPKALANETQKIKLGVVDKIRKTARGIEAHFALDNDGAAAVAAGWKLPSAFWLVMPIGNEGDAIRARPFKLLSVALTQFPNISGVESLANARPSAQADTKPVEPTERTNTIMKQLLIGWLAAQGIALSNDSTDQAVFDAFNKEMSTRAANISALGNEKTTLNGSITTLTTDRDAHKKRADDAVTALGNEQNVRKAERKGRAEMATDLAIQRGKKTVAERDATITALENSTDFDKDVKALLEGKPVIKTEAISGKQSAALGNEAQQTQAEYQEAFKTELIATGQNAIAAHNNIMRLPKYSGLAAKLTPAKS